LTSFSIFTKFYSELEKPDLGPLGFIQYYTCKIIENKLS